jgi:hypothetical protein
MALVNTAYFTSLTASVNACRTCQDLQKLVTQAFGSINPVISSIAVQEALLAPLLIAPSDLPGVITWITNYITLLSGPYANLAIQLTELTAQVTSLTAAITAKAGELGGSCSITIPTP